jgi:hypothetical protein
MRITGIDAMQFGVDVRERSRQQKAKNTWLVQPLTQIELRESITEQTPIKLVKPSISYWAATSVSKRLTL